MLKLIRTYDFNFSGFHLRAVRHGQPCIARNRKRINRIRNNCPADTKIVLSDGVADAVSSIIDGVTDGSSIAETLFNRVNAQVRSGDLTSQHLGDRGFSGA
jgi:hypothetical protein